jgi:hypothetical protein
VSEEHFLAAVALEEGVMFSPRFLSLTSLVICLALLTCPARAADAKTATVEGKVTLDGKPLAAGKVSFHPKAGKAVVADLNKDGTYTAKKVPIGEVRISIKAKGVPKKYADPKTSGLTVEVKEGKQVFDIALAT